MPNTHDPYLTTVKITLKEAEIKSRRKKVKNKKEKPKSFLSQNIHIGDYIYLPESLQKLFLLLILIILPYMIGIITMTIIEGSKGFQESTRMIFDIFMLTWTIGYEILALLLLLLIIKSAFSFNRKKS